MLLSSDNFHDYFFTLDMHDFSFLIFDPWEEKFGLFFFLLAYFAD